MLRVHRHPEKTRAAVASRLQRSDAPTRDAVAEAVRRSVRQFGVRGCAGLMAREFGDHSEAAMDRMRLDPELVGEMPASSVRPASGSTRRAA